MASQVMQLAGIGMVGSLAYYLLRALGHREMAALLRIVCYALAATTAVQLLGQVWDRVAGIWEQINSSPFVQGIVWLASKLGGGM